jgi:DNA-binding GntR family transcriptional regulator
MMNKARAYVTSKTGPKLQKREMNLNNQKPAESKVDETERELMEMIRSGNLPAGQWLKQQDLANILNTSITPVREALRRLEVSGLVVSVPFQGVRVSEIPPEHIREIYLVHALLQSEAARLYIPKISNREIKEASHLNDQMRDYVSKGDLNALKELNEKMHLLLCGESHFTFLSKMIRFLWMQNPKDKFQVAPDHAAISIKEHDHILEAFSNRQADLAAALVKEHFIRVGRVLVAQGG